MSTAQLQRAAARKAKAKEETERQAKKTDLIKQARVALGQEEWSRATMLLSDASLMYKKSLANDDEFFSMLNSAEQRRNSIRSRANVSLHAAVRDRDNGRFNFLHERLDEIEKCYAEAGDHRIDLMQALRLRMLADCALRGNFQQHLELCEFDSCVQDLRNAAELYASYVQTRGRERIPLLLSVARHQHDWEHGHLTEAVHEEIKCFADVQEPAKAVVEHALAFAKKGEKDVQTSIHNEDYARGHRRLREAKLSYDWCAAHQFDWLRNVISSIDEALKQTAVEELNTEKLKILADSEQRLKLRQEQDQMRELREQLHQQLEQTPVMRVPNLDGLESRLHRGELHTAMSVLQDPQQESDWARCVEELTAWVRARRIAPGLFVHEKKGPTVLARILSTAATLEVAHQPAFGRAACSCMAALLDGGVPTQALVHEGAIPALAVVLTRLSSSAAAAAADAMHHHGSVTHKDPRLLLGISIDEDAAVLTDVMEILQLLTRIVNDSKAYAVTACREGAVKLAIAFRQVYPLHARLLSALSRLLVSLVVSGSTATLLLQEGGLQAMAAACRRQPQLLDLTRHTCTLVCRVAQFSVNLRQAAQAEAWRILMLENVVELAVSTVPRERCSGRNPGSDGGGDSSLTDQDADAEADENDLMVCTEAARALEQLSFCRPCVKALVQSDAENALSKALKVAMHCENKSALSAIGGAIAAIRKAREAEDHFAVTGHY